MEFIYLKDKIDSKVYSQFSLTLTRLFFMPILASCLFIICFFMSLYAIYGKRVLIRIDAG